MKGFDQLSHVVRSPAPERLGRGRPSKADAAQIDRKILAAAWETFLDVGYDAATMELLAERAGVTKTTLYLRHSDKAALLRATVNDRLGKWSREASLDDWMLGDTLEDRLIYFGQHVLKWAGHPEVMATARLVHGTTGEAGRVARELDRMMNDSMIELLTAEIIEYGHCEGTEARRPEDIARFFIGMLQSLADRELPTSQSPERQMEIARQVVAVLFGGRSEW